MSDVDNDSIEGVDDGEDRVYQIGEVAEFFDLTPRAIRFYEEEGLVAPIRKGRGRRKYSAKEIRRIALIVKCRSVGMNMGAITRLIRQADEKSENEFRKVLEQVLRERKRAIDTEMAQLREQNALIDSWFEEEFRACAGAVAAAE